MSAMSAGLWVALAAAVVQFTSLGSDFYQLGDTVRDAWFGIPHSSQLVLVSALTTFVLAGFAAGGRSPVSGRTAGIIIALVGLVAAAQIGYRMAVPPFKGCLGYNCGFTPKAENVTLLFGIWMALIGSIGAVVGGVMHAASRTAKETAANFWVADTQTGMTPWLGIAALSPIVMTVVGLFWLNFYTVPKGDGTAQWTAWMSIPHTAGLAVLMSLIIIGLVIAAARNRAPMGPTALGATIAVLALVASARLVYRMVVPPFYSGPAEGVFGQGAEIMLAAWVALGFSVLTMIAGVAHAASNRSLEGSHQAAEGSRSHA